MAVENIQFITAVWGEAHTQLFIDIGLPSLLSTGNIPGMKNRGRCAFDIYTLKKDVSRIEDSSAYQYLKEIIQTQIHLIEEKFESPHLMMSHCHRLGLQQANKNNAGSVFIPPDCIWSNGSMVNLEKIIAQNVSMVHMSGLRLNSEPLLKKCPSWRRSNSPCLEVGSRELIEFGQHHLHPITNDLFFRERSEKLMPANLLWTVENQGFLARCFHLHPLYVEHNSHAIDFKKTIDDDLGLILDPEGSRHYVVSDSDEIFAFEMSSLSHKVTATYEKNSISDVAAWAEVGTNTRHRELIKKPIRIHFKDIHPELWKPIEIEADQVVDESLELLNKSFLYLLFHRYSKNIWHRCYAMNAVSPEKRNITTLMRYSCSIYWYIYKTCHFIMHYYRWYRHRALHQIKYYLARFMHYYRWYKHRFLHQIKYYFSRLAWYKHKFWHNTKYYCARFMHYYRWYKHRFMHQIKYYFSRLAWYKHKFWHNTKYCCARFMHYYRWYKHRLLHQLKYYISRLGWYKHKFWHDTKYYCSRIVHYYSWYEHKVLHQIKYYGLRFMHYYRWYKHRLLHQLKYYVSRLGWYKHKFWHDTKYYCSRIIYYYCWYEHRTLHQIEYYGLRFMHYFRWSKHRLLRQLKCYISRLGWYNCKLWHDIKFYYSKSIY